MKTTALCLVCLLVTMFPASGEVTVNDDVEIFLSEFVPCAAGGNGEVVDLSGRLHTVVTFTINNNNVIGHFHVQPQGVSGVGETTGLKYQGTGVTESSFKGVLQNGQANITFVNNFRIIGQGPGNDFLVHETLQIKINADGIATVTHDHFMTDCK